MTEKKETKNRIYVVDYLKALAMISVIINHCNLGAQVEKDLLFPYFVGLAVPIFILISGFTFSLSYQKHEDLGMGFWYRKDTILPKLSRFILPYLPIFLLELVYRYVIMGMSADPFLVLRSLFFGGYGPGGYYITIVIQLLFVFPICYLMIKKWDMKGVLLLGIIQLIYQIIIYQVQWDDIYYKRFFLRLLIFLAVGIYLYLHKDDLLASKKKKILLFLSFVGGVVYIYFANYLNIVPDIFSLWRRTAMPTVLYVFPLIAVIVSAFLYKKIPGKFGDFLGVVGKATYHILLIQMFWFHIVKYTPILLPNILLVPLNLIVGVGGGILYFYLDEWLRKQWKQRGSSSKKTIAS